MSDKLKSDITEIGELKIIEVSPECSYNITFHKDDKNIGKLYWDDGVMKFEGKVEESAKVFWDYLLETMVNPYVKAKLAKSKMPMDKG